MYVCSTLEDAEVALEPIDVRAGIYRGFDAAGRYLNITTDGKGVSITLGEETPSHARELTELIRSFMVACGAVDAVYRARDLTDLVEAAKRYIV